jgi:hypothetical protein
MVSDQPLWTRDQGLSLTGCGERALVDGPLTAFFRPGSAPGRRHPHGDGLGAGAGPEQAVSGQRVPFAAGGVGADRVAAGALADGRMAVVSAAARSGRLTEELAAQCNEWVAALGSQIVVAHASQGAGWPFCAKNGVARGGQSVGLVEAFSGFVHYFSA